MAIEREQPPLEIVRFTPEAKKRLIEANYTIHTLTGQSIKSLRDQGRPFWSTWHSAYPKLEAIPSRMSEVAINPSQLFLPDSNGKSLKKQEQMIKAFSQELTQKAKIDGVEAVMGEMPDYVELVFTYLDATGDRLFGRNYGYNYARTKNKTKASVSGLAIVGNFGAITGLFVDDWRWGRGRGRVFAAPLVVPKAA